MNAHGDESFNLLDEIEESIKFAKIEPSRFNSGMWAVGDAIGHTFEALVFEEHAENPAWELEHSRISKLSVTARDGKLSYNWDRGLDIPARNENVQAIVGFLCAGLAEHVFGK